MGQGEDTLKELEAVRQPDSYRALQKNKIYFLLLDKRSKIGYMDINIEKILQYRQYLNSILLRKEILS